MTKSYFDTWHFF